jgi:cbb3-type cytochrome oxidase maturation protein
MDSLYLLLPLSVLLVLALIGLFAWALHGGQFDDLEREGWRVIDGAEPLGGVPLHPVPDHISQKLDVAQAAPRNPENNADQQLNRGAAHE